MAEEPIDPAQQATRGVTVELLQVVDLDGEIEGLEGRQLRLRKVTMAPGAVFGPLHDHRDRPGTVFVIQGTITDHRDGTTTDYGPGPGWPEDRHTLHWLENRGDIPAIEISVDIVRKASREPPGVVAPTPGPAITAGHMLAVVVVPLIGLAATRRLTVGRWLATAIFAVYLVGAANFALLPLYLDRPIVGPGEHLDLASLIELRPFFVPGVDAMPFSQVLLNILLTIPFGFGLPFVLPGRRRPVELGTAVLVGLAVGLGLELTQLLIDASAFAAPAWSIDVNDVFCNWSGVVAGFGLFRLAGTLYARVPGIGAAGRGPWAHFHNILLGDGPTTA